ncbi:hypothetical protein Tco_0189648 [Tanacetum coccineum]
MLAPKCATYNGRSTFANPKYLKIAQSEKPCLYEIPYDTSDHANRFCPNGEETVTLEKESRSKLNKDTVKPYDYTYQNSLYEIFKPPSKTYLDQLERAKEVRKTMWRKTTSNVNVVCAECGKCVFNSTHDASVSKYLNVVNARTKKPKGVLISANTTIQKPKSYFKELYENTNKAWEWWIRKEMSQQNTNGQTNRHLLDLILNETNGSILVMFS